MPVCQMPVRGSNCLWTRTLDRYTRVGLPECVVSTVSGPPLEAAQDRTQGTHTHTIPGYELKFLTPPGYKAGTLPTKPRRRIYCIYFLIAFNMHKNIWVSLSIDTYFMSWFKCFQTIGIQVYDRKDHWKVERNSGLTFLKAEINLSLICCQYAWTT